MLNTVSKYHQSVDLTVILLRDLIPDYHSVAPTINLSHITQSVTICISGVWGLAKLKWPQVGKGDLVLVLLRLKDSACDTQALPRTHALPRELTPCPVMWKYRLARLAQSAAVCAARLADLAALRNQMLGSADWVSRICLTAVPLGTCISGARVQSSPGWPAAMQVPAGAGLGAWVMFRRLEMQSFRLRMQSSA